MSIAAVAWSVILGGAFAYGCIVSSPAPSMPPPEKRPFICHPPVLVSRDNCGSGFQPDRTSRSG